MSVKIYRVKITDYFRFSKDPQYRHFDNKSDAKDYARREGQKVERLVKGGWTK